MPGEHNQRLTESQQVEQYVHDVVGDFDMVILDNNGGTRIEYHFMTTDLIALAKLMSSEHDPAEVAELKAEIRILGGHMKDAASEIADWAAYSDEFFQDKHGLKHTIEMYRKIAEAALAKGGE